MELIVILHALRQRWKLAIGGVIAAVAIGLSAAGLLPGGLSPAAPTRSGIAESKVIVTSKDSLASDAKGATGVLGTQAALLATLIANPPQRETIARQAGVALDQLDVLVGDITVPAIPSTLARTVTKVVQRPRLPFAVTVRADSSVSIITIETAAPSPAKAAELAAAATTALAAVTATNAPSPARALVVKPLGAVRSLELVAGQRSAAIVGIAATLACLFVWCWLVVALAHQARRRRVAAA